MLKARGGLDNGYFWPSALDLLLHSNFLSKVFGTASSLFPERQLRDFLTHALDRQYSP
jgi:hypothetical protein